MERVSSSPTTSQRSSYENDTSEEGVVTTSGNDFYQEGMKLWSDNHMPPDEISAARYNFNQAYEGFGHLESGYMLVKLQTKGGVELKPETIGLLKELADKGQVNAAYKLGSMYATGDGVPKDYRLALHYFQIAANNGIELAHTRIGFLYQHGHGVTKDLQRAMHHFRLAAKKEDWSWPFSPNKAIHELYRAKYVESRGEALSLYWGAQVCSSKACAALPFRVSYKYNEKTCEEFNDLYSRAQEGYKESQFSLGKLYQEGDKTSQDQSLWSKVTDVPPLIPQSNSTAIEYFLLAHFNGYPDAAIAIGDTFLKGTASTRLSGDNEKMAIRWYKYAMECVGQDKVREHVAKLWDAKIIGMSQFVEKCCLHAERQGLTITRQEGRIPAKKLSPDPEVNYCVMYRSPEKYRSETDKQRSGSAELRVGQTYQGGYGIAADPFKAKEYFYRAHEKGHPEAPFYLGQAYENEGEKEVALEWYCMASQQGGSADKEGNASYAAALLLEKKDPEEFQKYLKLADQRGHLEAAYKLGCWYASRSRFFHEEKDLREALYWLAEAEKKQKNSGSIMMGTIRDKKKEVMQLLEKMKDTPLSPSLVLNDEQ